MSRPVNSPAPRSPATPWWREPTMWLVIGGPVAVIAASVLTITLAIRHPDPVLQRGLTTTEASGTDDGGPVDPRLMPAHQARNHTATPASALPGRRQ
ncbi:MAG: hypothetical protein ACK4ZD_05035 [Caldimonas sp.]|uniref:hypothetical protein n=1 Tax=Caldimonas sp. TaxID=2838790 RepID=UPI00391B758C